MMNEINNLLVQYVCNLIDVTSFLFHQLLYKKINFIKN